MALPLPTTGSLLSPSTPRALLVVFSNAAGVWRYTNWESDIEHDAFTFKACPLLDVQQKSEANGSLEDANFELRIDKSVAPVATLILPVKSPRTLVEIFEFYPADCSAVLVHSGLVGKVTSRPHDAYLSAAISIRGIKSLMRVPLGISCTSTCAWVFGDKSCKACPGEFSFTDMQVRVDGWLNRVTFTAPAAEALSSGKFIGGILDIGGTTVGITKVISQVVFDYTVEVLEVPPLSWNGASGICTYGCDKRLETCRSVWNNEENFGGLGIKMPITDPTKVSAT